MIRARSGMTEIATDFGLSLPHLFLKVLEPISGRRRDGAEAKRSRSISTLVGGMYTRRQRAFGGGGRAIRHEARGGELARKSTAPPKRSGPFHVGGGSGPARSIESARELSARWLQTQLCWDLAEDLSDGHGKRGGVPSGEWSLVACRSSLEDRSCRRGMFGET